MLSIIVFITVTNQNLQVCRKEGIWIDNCLMRAHPLSHELLDLTRSILIPYVLKYEERNHLMNVKPAFIYGAITCLLYGIGLLFIPVIMFSWFGLALPSELTFFSQIFAAALIGFAVIFWMSQGNMPSEARRNIILGETVHSGIATIIWIIAIIMGIGNALMFLPLFSHLSLAIWFGYLYWKGAK